MPENNDRSNCKGDFALFVRILTVIVVTLVLVLLANQIQYIGGRIPYVFLVLWFGSATVVALVFVPNDAGNQERAGETSIDRGWAQKTAVATTAVSPLSLVPLLEICNSGPDPMIWLMNAALVISLCSTPYFALVSRRVVGAVVLTWGAATVLSIPSLTVLFQVIKRAEMDKLVSTVDTDNTMHAFFEPEYRYLFYAFSAGVLLLYCPAMLLVGYRSFLRSTDA